MRSLILFLTILLVTTDLNAVTLNQSALNACKIAPATANSQPLCPNECSSSKKWSECFNCVRWIKDWKAITPSTMSSLGRRIIPPTILRNIQKTNSDSNRNQSRQYSPTGAKTRPLRWKSPYVSDNWHPVMENSQYQACMQFVEEQERNPTNRIEDAIAKSHSKKEIPEDCASIQKLYDADHSYYLKSCNKLDDPGKYGICSRTYELLKNYAQKAKNCDHKEFDSCFFFDSVLDCFRSLNPPRQNNQPSTAPSRGRS